MTQLVDVVVASEAKSNGLDRAGIEGDLHLKNGPTSPPLFPSAQLSIS